MVHRTSEPARPGRHAAPVARPRSVGFRVLACAALLATPSLGQGIAQTPKSKTHHELPDSRSRKRGFDAVVELRQALAGPAGSRRIRDLLDGMADDAAASRSSFDLLVAAARDYRWSRDEDDLAVAAALRRLPEPLGQVLADGVLLYRDAGVVLPMERREALTKGILDLLPKIDAQGRLAAYGVIAENFQEPRDLALRWLGSNQDQDRIAGLQLLLAAGDVAEALPEVRALLGSSTSTAVRRACVQALSSDLDATLDDFLPLLRDPSAEVRRTAAGRLCTAIPPWAFVRSPLRSEYYAWQEPAIPAWIKRQAVNARVTWSDVLLPGLRDADPWVRIATAKSILKLGLRDPELLAELSLVPTDCSEGERAWRSVAGKGLAVDAASIFQRMVDDARERIQRGTRHGDGAKVQSAWALLCSPDPWPCAIEHPSFAPIPQAARVDARGRWRALECLAEEFALSVDGDPAASFLSMPSESAATLLGQLVIDHASKLAMLGRGAAGDDVDADFAATGSAIVPLLASEWLTTQAGFLGGWEGTAWDIYGRWLQRNGPHGAPALVLGIDVESWGARASVLGDWYDAESMGALMAASVPILWSGTVWPETIDDGAWGRWEDASGMEAGRRRRQPSWIEHVYGGREASWVSLLLPGLEDSSSVVRARSCQALAALKELPASAEGRIRHLLSDAEPRVRYSAAHALLRSSRDAAVQARAQAVLEEL